MARNPVRKHRNFWRKAASLRRQSRVVSPVFSVHFALFRNPAMSSQHHQTLPRSMWVLLVLLTFGWGFNWPMMKLTLADMPVWTFPRTCVATGAAGLFLIARLGGQSLRVPQVNGRGSFDFGLQRHGVECVHRLRTDHAARRTQRDPRVQHAGMGRAALRIHSARTAHPPATSRPCARHGGHGTAHRRTNSP